VSTPEYSARHRVLTQQCSGAASKSLFSPNVPVPTAEMQFWAKSDRIDGWAIAASNIIPCLHPQTATFYREVHSKSPFLLTFVAEPLEKGGKKYLPKHFTRPKN